MENVFKRKINENNENYIGTEKYKNKIENKNNILYTFSEYFPLEYIMYLLKYIIL